MLTRHRLVTLAGLALAGGCAKETVYGDPRPIVTPDGWRRWEGVDPFGEQGDRLCDPLGYGPEDLAGTPAFQVNTGQCDWATVYQRSTVAIGRDDRLEIRVFHDVLTAPSGGTATVGVSIEDEIAWQDTVQIPADSGFLLPKLELDEEVPAGTALLFHVDNHGANSYHLLLIGVASPL